MSECATCGAAIDLTGFEHSVAGFTLFCATCGLAQIRLPSQVDARKTPMIEIGPHAAETLKVMAMYVALCGIFWALFWRRRD